MCHRLDENTYGPRGAYVCDLVLLEIISKVGWPFLEDNAVVDVVGERRGRGQSDDRKEILNHVGR